MVKNRLERISHRSKFKPHCQTGPNDDVPLHAGERMFVEKVNKFQNLFGFAVF